MTGSELKAWMSKNRWGIHRLADEMGIHPSTVQRYRDGTLPVPRLVEIAVEYLEHTK